MQIILASTSPRRQKFLDDLSHELDFTYKIIPNDYDESTLKSTIPDPATLVQQLSLAKAQLTYDNLPDPTNTIVIGADTMVAKDGHLLGKPTSPADATKMLTLLSNTTHQVHTGMTLIINQNGTISTTTHLSSGEVHFKPLTPTKISTYIATGEPMDKAGAYAIQGLGAQLVSHYTGSYNAIIGLDVDLLKSLLTPFL